jgi:hypothetical protein
MLIIAFRNSANAPKNGSKTREENGESKTQKQKGELGGQKIFHQSPEDVAGESLM